MAGGAPCRDAGLAAGVGAMSYDPVKEKVARRAMLKAWLARGEQVVWDSRALCLECGTSSDNEGFLAYTDRRFFFVQDIDRKRPVDFDYNSVASVTEEPWTEGGSCATVALNSGEEFHFVTGKKAVKVLKRQVRSGKRKPRSAPAPRPVIRWQ
jgi:hypothetical protein